MEGFNYDKFRKLSVSEEDSSTDSNSTATEVQEV